MHPNPAINKMTEHFNRLAKQKYKIPEFIQVMIIVNRLLHQYNHLTHLIFQAELADLKVDKIRTMVIQEWERKGIKYTSKEANKISVSQILHI